MNLVPFSVWLFVFETLVFLDSSPMVLKKRCVGYTAALSHEKMTRAICMACTCSWGG